LLNCILGHRERRLLNRTLGQADRSLPNRELYQREGHLNRSSMEEAMQKQFNSRRQAARGTRPLYTKTPQRAAQGGERNCRGVL